jgi:hypothetical protein
MSGLVYEKMLEKRIADYGGVFVLLTSFGVYLKTLTPTVGLHDCGDMITSFLLVKKPGFRVCLINNEKSFFRGGEKRWE